MAMDSTMTSTAGKEFRPIREVAVMELMASPTLDDEAKANVIALLMSEGDNLLNHGLETAILEAQERVHRKIGQWTRYAKRDIAERAEIERIKIEARLSRSSTAQFLPGLLELWKLEVDGTSIEPRYYDCLKP